MSEQLFTLDEAQAELARRECSWHGHDFDVLTDTSGPLAVLCSRCGRSWPVTRPTPSAPKQKSP